MDTLDKSPPEFHRLPFHLWRTFPDSLSDSAHELLWHKCLIHCGEHTLRDIHKHVDGVPYLSKVICNVLTHCVTCLKTNLTKSPAGHYSIIDLRTTPYQDLCVDFGFPGLISKEKDGKIIKSICIDIEELNG